MFIVLCAIKCVREVRYIKLIGQPFKRRAMNIYSITDIGTNRGSALDSSDPYYASRADLILISSYDLITASPVRVSVG
jgi:hypothetical protein